MSEPTMEDHWNMISRDGISPLDFDNVVSAMGWLISAGTAPPYQYATRT